MIAIFIFVFWNKTYKTAKTLFRVRESCQPAAFRRQRGCAPPALFIVVLHVLLVL
jgi:hypothetical protein